MPRPPVTMAIWHYDRVRPIVHGRAPVEGCDIDRVTMPADACFERAFFDGECHVAESGFGPYLFTASRGMAPYVAVSAFPSRTFRHPTVYTRVDSAIEGPADLRGKRGGVPDHQMSAVMWLRGSLRDTPTDGSAATTLCSRGSPERAWARVMADGLPLDKRVSR